MTLLDYSHLKHQVIQSVVPGDNSKVETLKELFSSGINSVRRFEQIKTIRDLLQVLELRGLLTENNVTPLKDIAKRLKNKNLLDKISEYEGNHECREDINYYASEKANKSMSFGDYINNTSSVKDRRKELITQIITEQIGSSWRNLARNLKIQECKIDDIEDKCGTLKAKASEVLKLFFERADSVKWHFVLCDALDKTGRMRLRISVQEILMMNMNN